MLLFILQVTFFSAWLVLDEQRQHNMKVDCCPCCSSCCTTKCGCCRIPDDELEAATAKVQADLKPGRISNYIKDSYAPVIMKTPVRAAIAVLFAGILAVCVNGALKLSVESATKSFIPDGSYLLETMDMMDKYYSNDGTTLYVVTPDNLDVYAERDKIKAIKEKVKANKYLRDPDSSDTYVNWLDEFEAHCSTMGYNDCTSSTSSKTTFDSRIKAWLSAQGGKYQMYFKFSGDGKPEGTNEIVSTRIEAEFIGMKKTSNDRMQDDAAEVVKAMEDVQAAKWGIDGAYVFTYQFLEWETYKTIYEELFMNVSLCLVAVLVITTLLIGHPVTSVLVFITVVMTVIDILGCMYYWGLVIDNVSVIQAVIAIGLCVDYAAHVGHCFMLKAGTRSERVIACLADVGAAVLNGGVSTFLAVMLLALSKSYVFRVLFQQFFLTVVFGLAHGMILLPVLLATFGPACYASAEATAAEGAGKVEMSGKGGGPVVDEPTKVMA
jgi:predicted RND superfamily exporter protein